MEKYEHLIGGFFGGVTSTIACHPLDLLRIRYSANDGNPQRPQYRNYWHATRSIVVVKGCKGLYQGLSPNLIGSAVSWGLYFQFYHIIKNICVEKSISIGAEPVDNVLLGMITGAGILLFTNPVWVAKTRLCLQYENERTKYSGFLHCLRTVARNEGVTALYRVHFFLPTRRGFTPGVIGTVHGAIQFMLYNRFKDDRLKRLGLPPNHILDTVDCLIYSGVSKIIATTITFPYQVLRTRLQDHHAKYSGLMDLVIKTYKMEGMYGFYKGLLMGNLRQLPNVVVTYVTYENVRPVKTVTGSSKYRTLSRYAE
uniref:Mitochondrial carrier protein n=1 Tax=Setaria digitata TaxID=48799 RepID=A0A915PL36_9BILA